MFRTLLLVSVPAALTIGSTLQASANPKEICEYVNDRYRYGAVTCGCPTIKDTVITIPLLTCAEDGQWTVKPEGCGSVSFNGNAEAMHFYVNLRKTSKC